MGGQLEMAMEDKEKAKKPDADKAQDKRNEARISAPWSVGFQTITFHSEDSPSMRKFLEERTKAHELYIREEARTKRLTTIIAAVFLLAAIAVVLFAPDGREIRSIFISAVLLIFAAGSFGYKRVWGKAKGMSFGADNDLSRLPQQDDSADG